MKLYYMPGASSLLPHIVLVEAGLSFDAINVDEHTKALEGGGDYRTVNPLGYVPALQLNDGTVLVEAAAVAQYVADRVPAKRLAPPNGTLARAKLQSWMNFISSEMQLAASARFLIGKSGSRQADLSPTPRQPLHLRGTASDGEYLSIGQRLLD